MNIESNYSLQALNTFGFAAYAEHFVSVSNDEQLLQALAMADEKQWPVFLLGGGSNLVLTNNIPGLVIHQINQDTVYQEHSNNTTIVTAGAGKPWHDLVIETLEHGLIGLENLSLIPGNTGAAPVQNIGAYGVELNTRLHNVRAFHRPSSRWLLLTPSDCAFHYRDSVFKQNPNDYVITHVSFLLSQSTPAVLSYAALKNALLANNVNITPNNADESLALAKIISQTVINIRQSKLPDPNIIGNAGSFFKNPVVSAAHAQSLQTAHPNLVSYPQPDGRVKLAAGWMIDSIGYKGYRAGNVGVHTQQALVLVHHGEGSGQELMKVAREIIDKVDTNFGVRLEIEPIVV